MSSSENKKVAPLKNDQEVPGQKFVCMSFISPDGNQKHKTRGFKVKQSFDSEEEARMASRYFQDEDSAFDVYVAQVGSWVPFPDSPDVVKNIEYENKILQAIVSGKREAQEKSDLQWTNEKEKMEDRIRYDFTPEGQEALSKKIEPAESLLFKISQLEQIIALRQTELSHLNTFFEKKYPDHSRDVVVPKFEAQPIRFDAYTNDQEAPVSAGASSSSTSS